MKANDLWRSGHRPTWVRLNARAVVPELLQYPPLPPRSILCTIQLCAKAGLSFQPLVKTPVVTASGGTKTSSGRSSGVLESEYSASAGGEPSVKLKTRPASEPWKSTWQSKAHPSSKQGS